jgi:hypothetical protein
MFKLATYVEITHTHVLHIRVHKYNYRKLKYKLHKMTKESNLLTSLPDIIFQSLSSNLIAMCVVFVFVDAKTFFSTNETMQTTSTEAGLVSFNNCD